VEDEADTDDAVDDANTDDAIEEPGAG